MDERVLQIPVRAQDLLSFIVARLPRRGIPCRALATKHEDTAGKKSSWDVELGVFAKTDRADSGGAS